VWPTFESHRPSVWRHAGGIAHLIRVACFLILIVSQNLANHV
jgi:hypothetical protein